MNIQKLKKELEQARASLKSILNNASDAIFVGSPKTNKIVDCNLRGEELLERRRSEIIGQPLSILRSKQRANHYKKIFSEMKSISNADYDDQNLEVIITKKGKIKNVLISSFVAMSKEEPLVYGIFHDITQQKEQENKLIKAYHDLKVEKHKLLEERNKIEIILQNIGDGVVVLNPKLEIIVFNKKAEKISGFLAQEILGKKFHSIFKKNIIETENKHDSELIRKDGQPITISSITTSLAGEENSYIITFRDVTLEREVDQMKSEFVSIASHQLRTPLAGIKWNTEILMDGVLGKLTNEQLEFIEKIKTSNERLIKLVNELLDISHIETGRKFEIRRRKSSITKIVREILNEQVALITSRKIKVFNKINKNLKLSIDRAKIKQVFQNLIENALKYSQENNARVTIDSKIQKNEIIFSVADNGIGIPEHQQDKIFEKFFRADNAITVQAEGSGLGLYAARAITEAHQGKMWLESNKHGSVFYFSLPK